VKLLATRKADQNSAVLDPWTGVHLGVGLASGLLSFPLIPVVGLGVIYEVLERFAETSGTGRRFFQTSGPEHGVNAVADVLVMALGWWLGVRYNRGA
jgi:hypothetical protein